MRLRFGQAVIRGQRHCVMTEWCCTVPKLYSSWWVWWGSWDPGTPGDSYYGTYHILAAAATV